MPKKKAIGSVSEAKPEMTVFSMKVTKLFRHWMGGLARHNLDSLPQMIERAVLAHAKQTGYGEPKPQRTRRRP
jgi:hypothetical protein